MENAGTYALVILSEDRLLLPIGKLGTCDFPSGYYIYVKGLNGRLKRHLMAEKTLHWHVDYLLLQATVIQICYSFSKDKLECVWNSILAKFPAAMSFIPGFGSSDCKCRTHLTYFLSIPSFDSFRRELRNRKLTRLH